MSFLTPLALLGAAIIGPLIVAMYFLKLRREERTVSSTFLWQRMVRDVEANAPWQKLRRNILLLLQLLLLLLLVLALARPFMFSTGISGRNLILIIDRSASMGATDVAPSRLEAAKTQAITLVDQLPDDGRATVIAAGGQMEVPAASSSDRRELRSAISAIELRNGGGSDLSQALTLASALAAREEQSEVAIISDGNVSFPADVRVPATVRYFPIGNTDTNVAISALSLQPSAGGQTLFVQATNYGANPVTRRVDLFLDDRPFNAFDVTLEPGREASRVFDIPAQVQTAEARLGEDDALPTDNRAVAVSIVNDATTIRVVTPGNRFLETGLSLLPGLQAQIVPTSTTTFTETVAEIPVTIFDGVVPDTLPPGNVFFINPPRSTEFFSVTGTLDFPAVRPLPGDEPLLRNVSLSEVSVLKAARLTVGNWGRVVVDGDGAPLLVAGERDGRRVAVLAFALQESDLPLQVAFPLLLSNLVNFLAPGSGAEAAQLAPGQPLALPIDQNITEVRLTRPDGSVVSSADGGIQVQNGQAVYADTDALGVYAVEEFRNQERVAGHRYAVNLFTAGESRIGPQQDMNVPQTSGLQSTVAREQVGRDEFWRWLAALALLVLVIEWLVYQRNGIAYLRDRWRNRGKPQKPVRAR
ncbi:MAG: BatA and WFA domain-containing protein [Chloroflexaceae bacterium]|jgi:hypothetical protein|nr:BatA and WFA domain-containing protein [Chloroflexaceae bacterium]